MISHSRRHCVVELQALPARIGQVRRIVSAQLRYWQLDPLIDRAALGVTELLSNVHLHAQPDKACVVELELLLGRLTVSVRDNDPRLPVLKAADPLETCGRGLALVEALSEAWGARHHADSAGKVVWFSLRAATAPRAPVRPVRIHSTPVRENAPPLLIASAVASPDTIAVASPVTVAVAAAGPVTVAGPDTVTVTGRGAVPNPDTISVASPDTIAAAGPDAIAAAGPDTVTVTVTA
ncbi:ATP-binding protein [Streptomyces bambusae]|uniref:ATP-binding protein n=1 Tax=Streptomyces bambusae TaxID=1550616 RepID=A0ABS6ZB57_9ACTN|nr:ATP-binding protein [Streptomyces bambusae]